MNGLLKEIEADCLDLYKKAEVASLPDRLTLAREIWKIMTRAGLPVPPSVMRMGTNAAAKLQHDEKAKTVAGLMLEVEHLWRMQDRIGAVEFLCLNGLGSSLSNREWLEVLYELHPFCPEVMSDRYDRWVNESRRLSAYANWLNMAVGYGQSELKFAYQQYCWSGEQRGKEVDLVHDGSCQLERQAMDNVEDSSVKFYLATLRPIYQMVHHVADAKYVTFPLGPEIRNTIKVELSACFDSLGVFVGYVPVCPETGDYYDPCDVWVETINGAGTFLEYSQHLIDTSGSAYNGCCFQVLDLEPGVETTRKSGDFQMDLISTENDLETFDLNIVEMLSTMGVRRPVWEIPVMLEKLVQRIWNDRIGLEAVEDHELFDVKDEFMAAVNAGYEKPAKGREFDYSDVDSEYLDRALYGNSHHSDVIAEVLVGSCTREMCCDPYDKI